MSTPSGLAALAALNGGKGPTPDEVKYLQSLNQALPSGVAPGSTSTANSVGADAYNYVSQNFPELAWMLQVPELASVINSIAQQGITDTNQIQGMVENTTWWKTQSVDVRNWYAETIQDPATAAEKVQADSQNIQVTADNLGVRLTQQQITSLAYAKQMNGWSDQELKNHIASGIQANSDGSFSYQPYFIDSTSGKAVDVATGRQAYYGPQGQAATPDQQAAIKAWGANGYSTGTFNGQTVYYQNNPAYPTAANAGGLAPGTSATSEPGGTLQTTQQQLEQVAKQYMVNVSPQALAQWSTQIAAGQQTVQGFQSYAEGIALGQFPWMAQSIKSGIAPLTAVSPYANLVQNELGIDSNNIDWTQPQWAKLLTTNDPSSGGLLQNTLASATKMIRTDPSYGWAQTPNGKAANASFAQTLAQVMGLRNFGQSDSFTSVPSAYGSTGG